MDIEDRKFFIESMKSNNIDNAKRILDNYHKRQIPSDILLPFVLRRLIQKDDIDLQQAKFAAECIRILSKQRCLSEESRNLYVASHQKAMLVMAYTILLTAKSHLVASDEIMIVFRQFLDLYPEETRHVKMFNLAISSCNRKSRMLKFQERYCLKFLSTIKRSLRRRIVPLLVEFIHNM